MFRNLSFGALLLCSTIILAQPAGSAFRQSQAVIETYKKQIQLHQRTGDQTSETNARYLLSKTYSELGMHQESIAESLANITRLQKPADHTQLTKVYNLLAWAYQQQNDEPRWNRANRMAIYHGKRSKVPRARAVAFLNEGNLFLQEKQIDKAVENFRTILIQIDTDSTLATLIPDGYRTLAEALRQGNRLTEALQVANTGLVKGRPYQNQMANIATYLTISKIHATQRNAKASLTAAVQALTLANQGAPPIARQEALRVLSDAQEQTGNPTAALKTTRQLAALTDSLNQINSAEAIASAEAHFDLKAKNQTIDLLNKNRVLRQKQTQKQQQNARIVIGLLTLTVFIVAFSLYRAHQTNGFLQRQKAEIETQASQLAELNRVKDELFSIVSHDLRGPVASLQQHFEQFDPASPGALPRLRQSVQAMAALIDNVLYWSLSQLGGLQTHRQAIDLFSEVGQVVGLYEEVIRQKKLRVSIRPDQPSTYLPAVLADEVQTEIVIRNIVQNAIKFSPVGGELALTLDRQSDRISLSVADEGPGFDWPTSQPNTGGSVRVSGTGLGLRVAEDLLLRNAGQIQVARRANRPGTVVQLNWPAVEPLPARAEPAEANWVLRSENK